MTTPARNRDLPAEHHLFRDEEALLHGGRRAADRVPQHHGLQPRQEVAFAGARGVPARWHTAPAGRRMAARPGAAQPTVHGTQRRLQALMARSWSPEAIERASGIPAPLLRQAVEDTSSISLGLAVAVTGVYDELWDRDPPRGTVRDREAAEQARAETEARDWAPPMAWDDDQLDLPDGKPAPGWKPGARTSWRAVDLVADAEFIREHGGYRDASMGQLAARLGVDRNQLIRAYSRARAYAARNSDRGGDLEAEAG